MLEAVIAGVRRHRVAAVVIAVVILAGAVPFFTSTTLIGDDHLFLAFSRYAPNPLVAFIRDQHGGEFYRPLPMLLWWVLGRLAQGAIWPFAFVACLLHLTVAIEIALLVFKLRGDVRTATVAGTLFFVAPSVREAAYWYSASTDLLATAFGLGVVLVLLRGGRGARGMAALLFAAACLSKESAIVVPALAMLVLRVRDSRIRWAVVAKQVALLVPVAVAYVIWRTVVLRGLGSSGDPAASLSGKVLQIASGLVLAPSAGELFSQPLAWIVGMAGWSGLLVAAVRGPAGDNRPDPGGLWAPLVWVALAVIPLMAAPWIVGARYFYLPAVGIVWLAARALEGSRPAIAVGICAALAGLGFAQAAARRADIVSYESRLSAARRAVKAGLSLGHTTFHIASGIKDLDLAVKADREIASHDSTLVVLSDVPASFVALPAARQAELAFLVARPPIPPAGAYRFGDRGIVGLARRGDDPTIDEVLKLLPDIRFVRLRVDPRGRVIYRDVTETWQLSDGEE